VLQVDVPTLAGRTWSRLLVVSEATTSLFDVLHARLADPVSRVGGVACVALTGRGFHGDRGRPWRAAEGNLHLSAAMPLKLPAASHALALTMLPPVAVIDAILAVTADAVRPGIKWINDIVVNDEKVAGVLAASRVFRGEIDFAVFGVGVNVGSVPDLPPTPFVPAPRCLRECRGAEGATLQAMLWSVLDALAARVRQLEAEGPQPLQRDYKQLSIAIGRRVRVWDAGVRDDTDLDAWPAPRAAGVVVDIDDHLALHLQGRAEAIATGRLAFEEACVALGM
jgi:biotin-[acetyl-CoA-carboxylase] ligase BirA-like protein